MLLSTEGVSWNMINKENFHFYREALNHTQIGLIITDPSIPNHPIIFVNKGFVNMSGYNEEELIGENSRILQGEHTNPKVIDEIRSALEEERSTTVEIYNYTKEGQPFWNKLTIDPMWIDDKLYYVGVQKDISELKEKESLLNKALEEMIRLSAPIVPIDDNISALPIIGKVDKARLEQLETRVLNFLEESKNDYLIMDLSGLLSVDPEVSDSFIKLRDLAQLIGTEVIITGVRPEIALSTKDIGAQLKGLHTYLTVQDAIKALT